MPVIFLLLAVFYLLGNIYVFIRGGQALASQSVGVKVLLSVIYWSCALAMIAGVLFRNAKLPVAVMHTIHEVGTGWLVFTLYMVFFLLFFDLLRVFNIVFKYSAYLAFFLTLCLLSFGYYNYTHPKKKVINMTLGKPVDNNQHPLKVVAFSDMHLGNGTNKAMLKHYVEMINAEKPDLILIGGDLIDNSTTPLYQQQMQEELNQLQAPLGIFMVPGNHEYISGIYKSEQFLKETPIQLLRDSVVVLPNGIQLIGRDDRYNASRKPLATLMENIDLQKPVIVLDHQPYNLQETADRGVDMQFSGHTHRGQIWPMSLIVDRLFEQSYGYRKWDDCQVYVSSGLSLWGPPFRLGTDSELVVFNLMTD